MIGTFEGNVDVHRFRGRPNLPPRSGPFADQLSFEFRDTGKSGHHLAGMRGRIGPGFLFTPAGLQPD